MQKYKDNIIQNIKTLVDIPSVYSEDEGYVFGENIDKCLDAMLDIMKDMGFKTFKSNDKTYGYAEIGEGELFGILGHLDVVPANINDGWNTDPFKMTVIDNTLYGRGVQDDKGPLVASIYAVKSLIDEGYKFNKRIRFIFGTDEETLWRCINNYCKNEEHPKSGFTPDSCFPLIYAEKGLLQVKARYTKTVAYKFSGGKALNAVASSCSCEYNSNIEESLKKNNFDYILEDEKIVVKGKSAHAKNPWKGVNALLNLSKALEDAGYVDDIIKFLNNHIYNKPKFEGFSDTIIEDVTGPLTINLGNIIITDDYIELGIDLRLPAITTKEKVLNMLNTVSKKYNLLFEEFDYLKPVHVDLNSEIVQNLFSSYVEITNDTTSKPMVSGGATYAKAFDNFVAFGPNFPGNSTSEHMPNECITIDNLMKCAEIYKTAIYKCCVIK